MPIITEPRKVLGGPLPAAEPEYPFMMFKVVSISADRAKSTTNVGGTE
jgi:hypothetical protein